MRISSNKNEKIKNKSRGWSLFLRYTNRKTFELIGKRGDSSRGAGLTTSAFVLIAFLQVVGVSAEQLKTYQINLPAQSVAEALASLSEQIDVLLLFPYEVAKELRANPLRGEYTLPGALEIMLEGTGFSGRLSEKGVLMISLTKSENIQEKSKSIEDREAVNVNKNLLVTLIGMVSGVTGAQHAIGQDEERRYGIEEIVVTAQKRSENLQNVPISVSAITSETLSSSSIRTSEDITLVTPGVNIARVTAATQIYIRGVGTAGGSAGAEPAVATFLDGVYIPSGAAAIYSLSSVERVEVLRGPQGTLYGRNATGGAVNIVTRTPSFTPELSAEFGYANLDTKEVSFYGSTGLSENVASDLAVYYYDMGEGYGKNTFNGKDVNDRKDYAFQSKTLINVGENGQVTLAADYSYTGGTFGVSLRPIESSSLLNGQQGYSGGFWDIHSDVTPSIRTKQGGVSGRIDYDMGWANVTSLTAYRELNSVQRTDVDWTDLFVIDFRGEETGKTFTQEFQLTSSEDSSIDWIAGLFYLKGDAGYDPFWLRGAGVAPLDRLIYINQQDTESVAIFGQATFHLSSATRLTLGGRFTRDERQFTGDGIGEVAGGTMELFPAIDETRTFEEPTWRVTLDHDFNDSVMGYATYSRGFKSGLFSLASPLDPPVDPETLDAYEVGLKTTLLDNRVRFNAAAFFYEYDNIQLTRYEGPSALLLNAAKAEIYGLEVELTAQITDRLLIHMGSGILDTKYTEFPNAPYFIPNAAPPFGNVAIDCVEDPAGCDASGNEIIKAPDWTFNFMADYVIPTEVGEVSANLSYAYNDGFYWEPDERLKQEAFHLVNSQIKWVSPSDKYHVRLWVRNVLDEKYYVQVTASAIGDYGGPAPGRAYGVSAGVSF